MKVFWLFAHPAPYKVKFFNQLGLKVDLTVAFERSNESDRNKLFYGEGTKNFKAIILKSIHFGHSNNYAFGVLNPLRKERFDIVVINGWSSFTEMKVIRYLKRHKIPYIFAINGGFAREKENFFIKHLKQKYIPGATLFLAPENNSKKYLSFYGADTEKIKLYSYSSIGKESVLSSPLSEQEKVLLRKGLGLPEGRLFVSVGSFIKRKNEMMLLRIWKSQPKENTLLLIGDGPLEDKYKRFIRDNQLTNVQIVKYQKHETVLKYFRIADASIFITNEDIYGHVVNESLSQGTPVIGSIKSNAVNHLLQEGINGYLVDPQDKNAIEKALLSPFTAEMREAALKTASKNTFEIMVEEHLEVFEEMAK